MVNNNTIYNHIFTKISTVNCNIAKKMNKKYLLLFLVLVFVISGCATRTRIGMFIPAHQLSNQRAGEEVWLHVTKINDVKYDNALECSKPEQTMTAVAVGGALASMAIGMAIDYVKSELQEEAKKYEASYGAKAWLTTKDLQGIKSTEKALNDCIAATNTQLTNYQKEINGKINATNNATKQKEINAAEVELKENNALLSDLKDAAVINNAMVRSNDSDVVILISRWVDNSTLLDAPPPNQAEYDEVLNEIEKLTTKKGNIFPAEGSTRLFVNKIDRDGKEISAFREAIAGKRLAFAYALSIHTGDSGIANSPFLVKPVWKWQWLSKAKVVALSPTPSPRALIEILAIPAALYLHTGSELDYNIRMSIDFLVSGVTDENKHLLPQMVSLGLKDPITGPAKHDLSGTKQYIKYDNPPRIGWLAIPGYPNIDKTGYFSLQLTVNESDPSNVKKTILKGSDYLEANRDDIVNRLNILK